MSQLPKVKQHRLHNEGSTTLMLSGATLLVVAALDYWLLFERCPLAFYIILAVFVIVFAIIVNFFRCPMRIFTGETENVVVAPADGKIVVIEEVEENEYFHDRRKMVSVFMSVTNVHANWFPVEGIVKWCVITMVTSPKRGCRKPALKTSAVRLSSAPPRDTMCWYAKWPVQWHVVS